MKIKVLATLLLSLLGLVGVMQGTSSARVGLITVDRAITLNIQNLGPDTSRYYGTITHSPAAVKVVATARVKAKKSTASLAQAAKFTIRKAPPKKRNKAAAQVQEFCNQLTRSSNNPVRVSHVPPAPAQAFQIGISPVDTFFGYSVTGVRAPKNDIISARQSGNGIASGKTNFRTGPWEWNGDCGPEIEALALMP